MAGVNYEEELFMRMMRMTIHNFKKIKDLTIQADGHDVNIFGENGTGKTTICDAFFWGLWGKSSLNQTMEDQIKAKDLKGQDIDHGIEHDVEIVFSLEAGKQIEFKRVFYEKWTKQRGSAEASFSGHTTDFFVNGVPVKKKDYQEAIERIVKEDTFKLLTNPLYFNEQLHWQDRRKILIDVCGDVADADVIAGNEKLHELTALIGDHSIEDFRKILAAQKAKINKELDRVPIRIDEVQRSFPAESETLMAEPVLMTEIESLKRQQAEVQKKIVQIQNGGAVASKQKQIVEIESQQLKIKNKYDHEINRKALEAESVIASLVQKKNMLQSSICEYKRRADSITACITKAGEEIVALRTKWGVIDAEQPEIVVSDTCPTCSQHLPVDQVEAAKGKLLDSFNLDKANRLKQINDDGKKKKTQMEADAAQLESISKDINATEAKVAAADDEINSLREQAKTVTDYTGDAAYIDAAARKEQLKAEIKELESGNLAEIQQLNSEIKAFDTDITVRQDRLALLKKKKEGEQRIKELEAEQSKLSTAYEDLEHQIFLTEEFIQTKVALMEEKINSKFKIARFKLFDTQINGGLQECCETLGNGVPYSAGLNTAATFNVGLDIINTLSDFYDFEAPIFIDGAESITKLLPMPAQVIRFIVSSADEDLRIETKNKQQAVA